MNIKLVFCAAALASFGLIACGDDTSGTGGGGQGGGGTGGSTTTTTTTTTTGQGGAGGGTTELTCAEACGAVYDCGAANDSALCPNFSADGIDKVTFVGDDENGCIATCNSTPALKAIINPDNCAGTVGSLKAVSTDFAAACDGAGGGGGAGGN